MLVCVLSRKKSKTRRPRIEMKTKVSYKRGGMNVKLYVREKKINYSTNNQNEMILFASKVK